MQSGFRVLQWMPEEPWDNAHRLFFVSPRNYIQTLRMRLLTPRQDAEVDVVVICDVDARLSQPRFRVFSPVVHDDLARYLFRPKSFRARIKMEDLRWEFPEVAALTDTTDVPRGDAVTVVRAVKRLGIMTRVSATKQVYSLGFEITERPTAPRGRES